MADSWYDSLDPDSEEAVAIAEAEYLYAKALAEKGSPKKGTALSSALDTAPSYARGQLTDTVKEIFNPSTIYDAGAELIGPAVDFLGDTSKRVTDRMVKGGGLTNIPVVGPLSNVALSLKDEIGERTEGMTTGQAVEAIARTLGKGAAEGAGFARSGGKMQGTLAGGQAFDALVDDVVLPGLGLAEARTPDERAKGIIQDIIPVVPAAAISGAKKAGNLLDTKGRDILGMRNAENEMLGLIDSKGGPNVLVATFNEAGPTLHRQEFTKRLGDSAPGFIDEDLGRNIEVIPGREYDAYTQLKTNLNNKVSTYTKVKDAVIDAADALEYDASMPPLGKALNRPLIKRIQNDASYRDAFPGIEPSRFEDIVSGGQAPTLREANAIQKGITSEMLQEKYMDLGPGAKPSTRESLEVDLQSLREARDSIRDALDSRIEAVVSSNPDVPAFQAIAQTGMGYKDLSRRQYDLLNYQEVLGSPDRIGRLESSVLRNLNISGREGPGKTGTASMDNANTFASGPMATTKRLRDTLIGGNPGGIIKDTRELFGKIVNESRLYSDVAQGTKSYVPDTNVNFGEEFNSLAPQVGAVNALPTEEGMASAEEPQPGGLFDGIEAPSMEELFGVPEAEAEILPTFGMDEMSPEDLAAMDQIGPTLNGPAPLPRDLDIILENPDYLESVRNELGPDAVNIMMNAKESGSLYKKRAALASIIRTVPDMFESGYMGFKSAVKVGDTFQLTDPAEAEQFRQDLNLQLAQNSVDRKWAFKQLNSLKNRFDMRLYPPPGTPGYEAMNAKNVKDNTIERLKKSVPNREMTALGEGRSEDGYDMGKLEGKAGDVENALRLRKYSEPAIAGIMGNVDVETGGSFDPSQKQIKGPGYGLFQFDFMKPYYKSWLKENDYTDGLDEQVEFVHQIIYGDVEMLGNKDKQALRNVLENSNDPVEIARVFSEAFLKPGKPHLDRRLASAKDLFSKLQG